MTLLNLIDLRFSYPGANTQTYNFDLELNIGEILAVSGKSGSGKSTLLDLIAGFQLPLSGQIILDGNDITQLSPSKRRISMLFQKYNLFEHITVLENICLGLNPNSSPTASDKQKAMDILSQVGLENFEHRRANTLSGGQMQRTALARELLRDSALILLDEPFNGLDEETRNIMLPLLKTAVAHKNRSIILVTHDLGSVRDIIDGAGEVKQGEFRRFL